MMRKLVFVGTLILLTPFIINLNVFADNNVTIIGTVMEAALDENDNITAVSIESSDGPYLVYNNAAGKRLLKLVGKNVRATGTVSQDNSGNTTITVKTYELLLE